MLNLLYYVWNCVVGNVNLFFFCELLHVAYRDSESCHTCQHFFYCSILEVHSKFMFRISWSPVCMLLSPISMPCPSLQAKFIGTCDYPVGELPELVGLKNKLSEPTTVICLFMTVVWVILGLKTWNAHWILTEEPPESPERKW